MLRITENRVASNEMILLLEGQLTNHWIEIARETCEQVLSQNNQLVLDVAGVTFADRNGIEFLQTMLQQQVELKNCSPFLTEQLKQAA
jgi:ABC-type transporter Mla MlaB component